VTLLEGVVLRVDVGVGVLLRVAWAVRVPDGDKDVEAATDGVRDAVRVMLGVTVRVGVMAMLGVRVGVTGRDDSTAQTVPACAGKAKTLGNRLQLCDACVNWYAPHKASAQHAEEHAASSAATTEVGAPRELHAWSTSRVYVQPCAQQRGGGGGSVTRGEGLGVHARCSTCKRRPASASQGCPMAR
jgi:hypothetical protein